MSDLIRLDPLNELAAMQRRFDRIFGQPQHTLARQESADTALDMYETDDDLVIKLSVPGFKPEDVQVTLTGDTLTIKGEVKVEKESKDEKRNYIWREIRHGAFQRLVTLPSGVQGNKATAEYDNGLLVLTFPKAEETKSKTIQVKVGKEQ